MPSRDYEVLRAGQEQTVRLQVVVINGVWLDRDYETLVDELCLSWSNNAGPLLNEMTAEDHLHSLDDSIFKVLPCETFTVIVPCSRLLAIEMNMSANALWQDGSSLASCGASSPFRDDHQTALPRTRSLKPDLYWRLMARTVIVG